MFVPGKLFLRHYPEQYTSRKLWPTWLVSTFLCYNPRHPATGLFQRLPWSSYTFSTRNPILLRSRSWWPYSIWSILDSVISCGRKRQKTRYLIKHRYFRRNKKDDQMEQVFTDCSFPVAGLTSSCENEPPRSEHNRNGPTRTRTTASCAVCK